MKILFFTENLRAGGKERRIIELLKGLKSYENIEIELVLTKNEIHYNEIFSLDIPIHIIERKYLKKDPLLFFRFYRIAKKFKPDIIHVWGHMVAVYAVPTKLLLGVPLINNEITDATVDKKLLGKGIVFKVSDRIIANTYAGLKAYNAPESKSHVIYNGFSFDRVKDVEDAEVVRKRFEITTTFVVGMVASFSEYKDYETYIQAAITILQKKPDITFLCIGDGDDSVLENGIPNEVKGNILFLGRQSKVEMIMNICDIGVLTTNVSNHGEGISNALMEFMALEKPVITTDFGGSSELVIENESGYLIDAFNPTQLVDKIIYLIENSSERNRIGKNAFHRITKRFGIDSMVKAFHDVYVSFVEKKP